jgi:hypothetical protein
LISAALRLYFSAGVVAFSFPAIYNGDLPPTFPRWNFPNSGIGLSFDHFFE